MSELEMTYDISHPIPSSFFTETLRPGQHVLPRPQFQALEKQGLEGKTQVPSPGLTRLPHGPLLQAWSESCQTA